MFGLHPPRTLFPCVSPEGGAPGPSLSVEGEFSVGSESSPRVFSSLTG